MQPQMSSGYELSPQQRQIFAQNRENTVAGVAILLPGGPDSTRIKQALQALVNRHEILRTSFQRRTGMKFPFQVVGDSAPLSWSEIDLGDLTESQQNLSIQELLRDSSSIDIENGPVFKATLVKLDTARHGLVLTSSLLCVDDASLDSIISEFAALYSGTALSDDVLQYADYSEWQREWLHNQDEETQQAAQFWNESLLGDAPAINLPFERKRASKGQAWNQVPVSLDSALLPSTAEDSEVFLLACWQVFLWRMTGQEEFALGYRSNGRNHEEFEAGVGVFAKTLPFAARFASEPALADFVELSRHARARALELQDNFSAEQLGGRLSAGFAFRSVQEVAGINEITRYVPTCDLRIQLHATWMPKSCHVALLFDSGYFEQSTVAQFADAFATLCRTAAADPSLPVGSLPITTEAEHHKVTAEFNKTATEYAKNKCIHQLFEECAASYPDRPALRFGDREFSFSQLNGQANRIAHVLHEHGISANVPVALCVDRSAEMIISLLGILKAGGCYLPLVPDNPKARLAHQLSETGAPVLLTEEKHLDRLPEFKGKIICLDRDRQLLENADDNNPDVKVSPDDLVYIIYTSGSTGTPKGVAVRHFNLVNYSEFICRRLGVDTQMEGMHFATVSTIAADLGNTCIFPSLVSGGCLHVIGYEMAMSPALFSEYASRHPIDVLKITPSHLGSLMESPDAASVLPRKLLVLGGEAARWDLIERVRASGRCAIFNHYGPTEATVGCCTFSVNNTDVSNWEPATVPVGRPIANDQVYILDDRMQPLPVGVAGELCIGGTGIAQGYLNQPKQTAERFVPDPFSGVPNARLYRTGDLARFLPDGNIEFLGRIDQQVKIRGFRVEPAEVEAVIKRHPAAKQAAVVAFDDKSGEKRLAAYVVGRFRQEELRAFVAQQLPDYMVPAAFVEVDSLPLTPNGKLDMRALPSPEQQAPIRESIAPRTDDEQKLAEIWREVLKLEQVGVTDNFFELGGHSLLATQIISRIRNRFRVQMPLQVFLQNPTIAALAAQIPNYPAIETEQEEMARLLQELEGISEEEAERLLAAEMENDKSV